MNTPYAGTYVLLPFYGRDARVSSVMIELRRDTYLTRQCIPRPDRIEALGRCLSSLIDFATEQAG